MPQKSRRSISYRALITCDDPRGVVECGTIRKSKSIPTQKGEHEKKSESHRRKQKKNTVGGEDLCSKEMAIGGGSVFRGVGEQAQSPTSLHLLGVSRGAQKLNHVISSWSNGHSKNSNTDIAKDLLKGALDLGESLAMLSSLQHSSSYTTGSTMKQQKQKNERGGFDDDLEIEEKDYVSLRDESHSGSSRNPFEEIERVIREGIDKKDVPSDPSTEEACDDRRLDSSDVPSTSSSQSSIVHSSNFVSPKSFLSSTASQKKNKKSKGSNLIAKLMGLEDASLRSRPHNPRKRLGEGEKIVNQKKPAFDDSPRARKHDHDSQKSGWKRRTLYQMIEAVKFKGHGVKSSSNSQYSEFSRAKQRWESVDSVDRPPIVIMRPLRFSCMNLEHPIIPKTRAEVDEDKLLKVRIRTNPLAQTDQCEALNLNEDFRKAVVDGSPIKNSSQGEGCVEGAILKEKQRVKESKAKERASYPGKSRPRKKQSVEKKAEKAQKLTRSRRKGEMKRRTKSESDLQFQDGDRLTILKLNSSRGANNTKIEMLQNATEKNGKQGTKSSSNSKKNWPESFKKVIKGAVQINGNQMYRDKNREVDSVCNKDSPLPLADSTRLAEDASQIEITDYVYDDHSSPSETPLLSSKRRNTQTALMITNQCGTTDHDRESQCSTSDNRAVEGGVLCSSDEKQLYSVYDTNLQNAHEVETVDLDHHAIHTQSPSTGDVAPLSINQSGATMHIEETRCVISTPSINHNDSRKGSTGENKCKALLLSSPSFINRVEELYNLKVNPDTDFLQQTDNDIDHNDSTARMLLDCANELMELHSSQCSTAHLPFPQINKISSISYYYTSFDHLLDEICDEIETLRCYRQGDGDYDSADRLLYLVKGDLRSKRTISGMWDIGWMCAGSADEIEKITRGVDELVLDGLMEEILVYLIL